MIGAVADIHSPKGLLDFIRALNNAPKDKIKLLILAGDVIFKGRVEGLKGVCEALKSKLKQVPTIAVFGNEEYDEVKDKLLKACDVIRWVDDNLLVTKVEDKNVVIIGSRGCLDEPTSWQAKNIPNIKEIYRERARKIGELLRKAKSLGGLVILVTHYPPTYRTLEGEPRRVWPQMACKALEKYIVEYKPNIVIHGHAHNSKVYEVTIGSTRVYNVSLPATKKITIIDIKPVGLERFLF